MKKLLCILICILSIMLVSCKKQYDGNSDNSFLSDGNTYEDYLQDDSYMELHPNVDKPHQPVSYMISEMAEDKNYEGLDTIRLLMVDKYEDYLNGFIVIDRRVNTAHKFFCEDIQGVNSKYLIFEGTDEFHQIQSKDIFDTIKPCDKCKDEVWFF